MRSWNYGPCFSHLIGFFMRGCLTYVGIQYKVCEVFFDLGAVFPVVRVSDPIYDGIHVVGGVKCCAGEGN